MKQEDDRRGRVVQPVRDMKTHTFGEFLIPTLSLLVRQLRHHPEPGGSTEEALVCGAGAELLGSEEAVEKQRAADSPVAGQPSAA